MRVGYHKRFNNHLKKLSVPQRKNIKEAIELFLDNPHSLQLRNHLLRGKWLGYRSISAGGDLRLHYRPVDDDAVLFVAAGTHSQLYG